MYADKGRPGDSPQASAKEEELEEEDEIFEEAQEFVANVSMAEQNCAEKAAVIYICPTGDCQWEGDASAVLNHFKATHQDLVIASNIIKTDIGQDNVLNRLMVSDDDVFLVQTAFRVNEAKLQVCLRYLGSPDRATRIRYSLEVDGTHNFGSYVCPNSLEQQEDSVIKYINGRIEIEVARITTAKDYLDFAVMVGEDMRKRVDHLDTVNELTEEYLETPQELPDIEEYKMAAKLQKMISDEYDDDDGDTKYIVVIEEEVDGEGDDTMEPEVIRQEMTEDDMIEMLQCVICRNQTFSPIYSCQSGHSLCENCFKYDCDVCGPDGGPIRRNNGLEEISRLVRYPCKYADCKDRFLLDELRHHEMVCKAAPYSCAVCAFYSKFRGTWYDMRQHFKNIHPSVKVSLSMELEISKGSESLIVAERGIFYCTSVSQNSAIRWKVIFCGPAERASNFQCQITLKGKGKGKKGKGVDRTYELELQDREFALEMKNEDLKKFQLQDKHAKIVLQAKYFPRV